MSAYIASDTVSELTTNATQLVTPEELLELAGNAGMPVNLQKASILEYGNTLTALVVRRMVLNAQMTFMAAYGFSTYSYNDGYVVADPCDPEGYYLAGNNLEDVVAAAYKYIQKVLTP